MISTYDLYLFTIIYLTSIVNRESLSTLYDTNHFVS